MVARSWVYPLRKKSVPQRKCSHSRLLSVNCSRRLSAEQETVLSPRISFTNWNVTWIWTFPARTLALIIFYLSCIAVASEWASLLHLLSMLPPGLAYEKVYLIVSFMPFSCVESFIGSFSPEVTLCLALIFLWSLFLASSTHTRPSGPSEWYTDAQYAGLCLCRCTYLPSFCWKTLNISNFTSWKKPFNIW